MELPTMFMESRWIGDEENSGGGTVYVVLEERESSVLLGEFGLPEEATYVTKKKGRSIFEAAVDERVDKPPFRKVCSVDRDSLEEALGTDRYISGEDIREAWENWSEGDSIYLRIEGEEREFNAENQRLMQYDRQEHHKE